MRLAIIVSEFNSEITQGLLLGAIKTLKEEGISESSIHQFSAPGAFEIPLMAKKLAQTGKYAGVIGLGCVIKGDTAHFEYISESCSHGLMQAMLETGVPMSFGILTTYTYEQAKVRSNPDESSEHNKGKEAALACLKTARFLQSL